MADSLSDAGAPARRGLFSRRLAFAFAAVAALTVALVAVLLSSAWNQQFDQYVRDNLQRIADGVAQILEESYPHYGGWTIQTLSTVPRFGSVRGIGVQIIDDTGAVIYDEATRNQDSSGDGVSDQERFVIEPNGPVVTSPVNVDGEQVGSVRVWTYGAGAVLSERDQQFRRGSLAALFMAGLISIFVASLGGIWFSDRLVKPIERITVAALALRGGDADARSGLSGDDEIGYLGRTFDEMADAIEADRELERRLTADVAHELRTPLQAIQATVEAMQDGVLPADEERLGVVRDETVRLGRLTDAILELTRLERGSLPFEMKPVALANPVRSAIDAHHALLETSELTVSVDLDESVTVNADADRLQQAVANLLSNAARYTPEGGRVEVSVRREAGSGVISVADTGIGIAEDDMARVFSRFWRADEARDRSTGGLGIGLAVTKEIVERHNGSIGAQNRDGGGSVFTIRLPLA